jgi:hypothetical protein
MVRRGPSSNSGRTPVSLYRRPSRLRRFGALLLTAGGALAVACGGGGKSADDPGQVWVESDGAAGRINMDDVQQAYRDAYTADGFQVEKFEQRVNEIYEGDNVVLVRVDRAGDTATISGWEDLNGDKQAVEGVDDKLFTITQDLRDGGNYTTQGHGANGYYHSVSPFGGFFTGLLIGNLLSGGRTTYVTSPARYDALNSSRASYRGNSGYSAQQSRNAAYGSSIGSRFGNAAASQTVSPARSSYQTRQVNSGAFRSSGSSSRSIGSGAKGGPSAGGGISGGGGRLRF